MNNAIQIQLQQISNGWVVGVPPEQPTQLNPRGREAKAIFCSDYQAVCECIKQFFPISAVE